ncbi:hypothetical protein [Bacillus atrophaeus]|uniref:Group-specific protein n=1 Tax=Bacillus atrophaeus (strain 1942) TaxID=720555 RepID=A0ABM5M1V9_BACA1|nr:hypothetical protein [Bacillus atrophaeus]AMR61193.1 hypothetical protein A1D11_01730 [Bacillus subtilis subsp. globigii]ADP34120.1 hypothetical protein BATR1942_16005 [Bacillus atrophaeus 1942]AIK48983.1 hypothetical protein DJ95_3092 [Bacillus atrophaeus subsp. globigii]EIM11198.1 hypothetical protein UY9_08845 [Bacillus atrophaeus C89]KFK82767.1 hypothetical protein DK44_540 [Bacillus atrophaeus]
MGRDQISQLQPLKFCDGWSVLLNNLNSEKRTDEENKLLILQNEKRNAIIKVIYRNNQYHIKVVGLKIDKIYEEKSFDEIEHLLEELERQIWSVGSGVLEDLQPLSQQVPNFLRLRIPAGWTVDYITIKDTDPKALEASDDAWLFDFSQDLLQISHKPKTKNLLLDVGWYPDGDPTGSYGIELIKNEDWENPVEDIKCTELKELIKQLDNIFMKVIKNEY